MKRWMVMAALLLAGCAAREAKWFNSELVPYVGKPLTSLIKVIGPPDAKLEVLDRLVYTWQTPYCKVQITVDSEDVIRTYHWDGDYRNACLRFEDALNQ